MKILHKEIYLRDRLEKDLDDYIKWFTSDTEWQNWDAPWEKGDFSEKEYREKFIANLKLTLPIPRRRFEICLNNDEHIGWMNSYFLDEKKEKLAIGIDIPEIKYRGKGYGKVSLILFINYLLENGFANIYTQTWSGNKAMILLAEKLGFDEIDRKKDIRKVNNAFYDALTFILNNDIFTKKLKPLL